MKLVKKVYDVTDLSNVANQYWQGLIEKLNKNQSRILDNDITEILNDENKKRQYATKTNVPVQELTLNILVRQLYKERFMGD